MLSQGFLDFDSLWDFSDPHQTETRFREILLQVPEENLACTNNDGVYQLYAWDIPKGNWLWCMKG